MWETIKRRVDVGMQSDSSELLTPIALVWMLPFWILLFFIGWYVEWRRDRADGIETVKE